ncbi:hypothetical protein J7337_012512 [Fusarium musae]|uniref:RNA helicase n=1 Tax=Fusarium musae TaxID=1042133 RepID=A0A9P8D636_9HYPO|nr:hypothetical protein J7337_012512 [Fusarium musae]KAG9495946.1 hypothetical protein J7337_012512 [Fusarium musae]
MNPFFENKEYSKEYLQIHEDRCKKLPVRSQRQEFLDKYHSEQVTIVVGDTGSGKTIQVSQFVLFDEWASDLRVACTQPRVVAATSVATRVAQELDVPLGGIVGYKVRFDNKSSGSTRLGFLTDGLLLQQYAGDANFSKYACIMIDEAHERTTNTDMLLALLKKLIQKRKDLKVCSVYSQLGFHLLLDRGADLCRQAPTKNLGLLFQCLHRITLVFQCLLQI